MPGAQSPRTTLQSTLRNAVYYSTKLETKATVLLNPSPNPPFSPPNPPQPCYYNGTQQNTTGRLSWEHKAAPTKTRQRHNILAHVCEKGPRGTVRVRHVKQTVSPGPWRLGRLLLLLATSSGLCCRNGEGEGGVRGPSRTPRSVWRFGSSAGCAFGWEDGADSFLLAKERGAWGHGRNGYSSPCPRDLPSLERESTAQEPTHCAHMA